MISSTIKRIFTSPFTNHNRLDVDDVKFVVNYDYPNSSEEYIHRIGRTARNNRTGTAYTLFTIQNASKANDLISVLKEANQVSVDIFILLFCISENPMRIS